MDRIAVLDARTAQLIAAGEVVERAASVVKELVENSVDAGASSVTVEIAGGGVERIRVADNGIGMSQTDAQSCFLCHATSKVRSAEDLTGVMTLGFRGEALASVAAVARVKLTTRERDAQEGTSVRIEGGKLVSVLPAGCPQGTVIEVSDLFYNTPARRKFLKSERAETAAVSAVMDKLALSHPEISFRYIVNGREALFTPGDGEQTSVLLAVLGRELSGGMLKAELCGDVRVRGFVSKPLFCKPSRGMQFFFVNSRAVWSRVLETALESAYRGCIMTGRFPACVLFIELDAHDVDVNVHPAKSLVKFSDEKKISAAVASAVSAALEGEDRAHTTVSVAPDKAEQLNIAAGFFDRPSVQPAIPVAQTPPAPSFVPPAPIPGSQPPAATGFTYTFSQNPELGGKRLQLNDFTAAAKTALEKERGRVPAAEYSGQQYSCGVESLPQFSVDAEPAQEAPDAVPRIVGELFLTYVVAEYRDEVWFIDKHAAHERLIYERLRAAGVESQSQPLLVAQTVSLPREVKAALLEKRDELHECGFEYEDFGANMLSVTSIPAVLDVADIPDVLTQACGTFARSALQDRLDAIYRITACKAAVKAGMSSGHEELEALVSALVKLPDVKYCPHGRPIVYLLTRTDFERFFKRTL